MPHIYIQFQQMQIHSQTVQSGQCHEQVSSKLYNRHFHLMDLGSGDSVRCWESPPVSNLTQSIGNINEIMLTAHLHYNLFFFRRKLRHEKKEAWARQHLAKLGVEIHVWRILVKNLLFTLNSEIILPWFRNCFITDMRGVREKQSNAKISAVTVAWIGHSFSG